MSIYMIILHLPETGQFIDLFAYEVIESHLCAVDLSCQFEV